MKANLIHHLAHTGDESVLRRIGAAWPFPEIPSPQAAHAELFAVPTSALTPAHLSFVPRTAWDFQVRGLHCLRLWGGGRDWFAEAEAAFSRALALEPSAWLRVLRAEARRSKLDYAGALSDFDAALAQEPRSALALAFKARVLFQMRTDEKDLGVLDQAIALAPREGWMLAWRGEGLRRLGKHEEAERDLRRALELDPLYDQAYGWLARTLEALGRPARAVDTLLRGIALCPDFEKAYRPLVRALRGAGRVGEALEALERAASLNHRNGWLGLWRVEGQQDSEESRAALAALDGWLATHADDARARRWRGEALGQLGRHEEAVAELDRALTLEPSSAWARAWKGESLRALGKAAEAREALDAAVGLDPDYGRAWAWRGRLKADGADWKGALADYEEALGRRRVEYAWLFAWRGEAQLELGRAEAALRDLDAAVALDAPRPEFRRLRARARHALGDLTGACEDLLRSVGDESFPWSVVSDAERLRRAGRAQESLAVLDPLCRRLGKAHPFLLMMRFRLKVLLGVKSAHRDVDAAFRLDPKAGWIFGVEPLPEGAPEAWAFLQDASVAEEPQSAPVWAYQGQARLSRGDRGGLAFLERAAALAPEGWILAWLGEARRKAGDAAGAREALEAALAADPKYANAWGWRGTLRLADDAAGAAEDLTRALKLQKSARFYKDRSLARRALKDLDGAADDMAEAVRLNPDLSWDKPSEEAMKACRLDEWRGEMALRLDDKVEAKKRLSAAIRRRPRFALSYAWRAECDLLSAQAGKDIEKALKLEPKLAQGWAAKAKRELLLNHAAPAADAARRAVRFAPYAASLRMLYARSLERNGKRNEAKAEAETALNLAPGFGEAGNFLLELEDPASPSLEFFTNYSCNAKCPFCFNPPDASPALEKGLSFAELSRRLYTGFQEGYRGVKFIGGEATLREDLPKVVGLAKKIGYRSIQLTTNGLRLSDPAYARRLTALGVDRYRFSIHGHTPALHDGLVAVPGALARLEQAIAHLRPLGVRLGINYVLSAVNYKAFPDTLEYFHSTLGIDDIIVYFLRYQGFAELPQNEALLKLRFKQAAPLVREGFSRLKAKGATRLPALIHFSPCVLPELEEHMLDWTRDPADCGEAVTAEDRVTLPDGSGGLIHEITNSGKEPVSACANCSKKRVCLGVESRYVSLFGDREFKPL